MCCRLELYPSGVKVRVEEVDVREAHVLHDAVALADGKRGDARSGRRSCDERDRVRRVQRGGGGAHALLRSCFLCVICLSVDFKLNQCGSV